MYRRIFTDCWEKLINKTNNSNQESGSNFTTLAPTVFVGDDLEDNKIYLDSLSKAIQMKENNNIALMGSYGSGKSSILKTYEKENPQHEYLFLSLASFLEKETVKKNPQGNSTVENEKAKTWETIETILVKQMIYKKAVKDLPYSRLKRITPIPRRLLLFSSLVMVIIIGFLKFSDFITKMIKEPETISIVLFTLVFFLSTYFVYCILSYSSRMLKLSKFSFMSFSIESSRDEPSHFSKYLDEIIYFFEVSGTNIVIIEDIDRFNSIIIFEHLRELNYLLNNSEQIKQDIKFIYAVRDDIFAIEGEYDLKESEEYLRTKFFDFIIPVIPVVDYTNSRNYLVPKVKSIIKDYYEKMGHIQKSTDKFIGINNEFNKQIEKFLWGISLYIDDLRLIYNICNEFEIYLNKHSHINSIEKIEKLFSLIVYKNIYPKDFSSLQLNHGMLYDVFHSIKDSLIKSDRDEIIEQIKRGKEHIEGGTYEVALSARTAIIKLGLKNFEDANLANIRYTLDNNGSSQLLTPLTKERINEFFQVRDHANFRLANQIRKIPKKEIEKNFHDFGVHTHEIIEALEVEEVEEVKREIRKLERELDFIDARTLRELIEDDFEKSTLVTQQFKNYNPLMRYLLGSGYIDEQYNYYISNVYENVLSAADIAIVQKLKSNIPLNTDEQIKNYEAVMYELTDNDYKRPAILNHNIILHIFNNDDFFQEQRSMLSVFIHKLEKAKKVTILKGLFKEENYAIKKFVTMLLNKNPKVFTELYNSEDSTNEFNTTFIYIIFIFCDTDLLRTVFNKNSIFETTLPLIPNFVVNLYSNHKVNRATLNGFFADEMIRFKEAGLSKMDKSDFEYFVENHIYQINNLNVLDIYERVTEKSAEQFSISDLLSSDFQGLDQDITDNFSRYVELLADKESVQETNETLIRILSESEIPEELKEKIMIKNSTLIQDVTEIINATHRRLIFKHGKYELSLQNVMNARDDEIEFVMPHFDKRDKINAFINEAHRKIETDANFEEQLKEFMVKLVNETGINIHDGNIDLFKMHSDYRVDGLTPSTFRILLVAGCIKPTISNINGLTGQDKIDLIALDEEYASENFTELTINQDELLLGIQQFQEPLLSKMVKSSFQDNELIVANRVEWLEEVLKKGIELDAGHINSIFSYPDILESDIFLKYLVEIIPKGILSDDDLLTKIPMIDSSLKDVRVGSYGEKKTDIRYYELLRVLSEKNIMGKVKVEDNKVSFWNRRT